MERSRGANEVGYQGMQRPRKSSWIQIIKSSIWVKTLDSAIEKVGFNLKNEKKINSKGKGPCVRSARA
jgi:hypothetical protein